MEALHNIGIFAAQTFIILFAIIVVIVVIALLAARAGGRTAEIQITPVHKKYKNFALAIKSYTLSKAEKKSLKKQTKAESKKEAEASESKKIFLIDFEGDTKASAVENLREEVSAILTAASPQDEVVLRVESPGGVVHGYGLAASQLLRIREKGLQLTVCVDKVAASGGYLMSCTANKIICAPFAIVGSIGVVAQVPNFHKTLKKLDVDFREYTAGEFKRTVSLLGEITPKGEEKFKEQLEETHILFKNFVQRYRPQLNVQEVATGEYWYGEQAITKGLIDEIKTSDAYLMELAEKYKILKVKHEEHKSFGDKVSGFMGQALQKGFLSILEDLQTRRLL